MSEPQKYFKLQLAHLCFACIAWLGCGAYFFHLDSDRRFDTGQAVAYFIVGTVVATIGFGGISFLIIRRIANQLAATLPSLLLTCSFALILMQLALIGIASGWVVGILFSATSMMAPITCIYINLGLTAMLTFGGIALLLILARSGSDRGYLMYIVFFAGSVGAVINNYYHIYKAPEDAVGGNLMAACIHLYVFPIISGILGFVAYSLCLSGLLEGGLFPRFKEGHGDYNTMGKLLNDMTPKSNLDAAKAIIWAFIAGFSEKFLLSVLDKFH